MVTLVTSGVMIATEWACTRHKSISQESLCFGIIELLNSLFISEFIVFMQPVEYILSDFSLPLGGSASEFIEITVEPVIYLFVNDMIMITYLFRCLFFLESFNFSGSAILVSAAHVERVVAHEAAIASEDVCTQHAPDDVTQVGDIVHVGEGTRD